MKYLQRDVFCFISQDDIEELYNRYDRLLPIELKISQLCWLDLKISVLHNMTFIAVHSFFYSSS